LLSLQAPRSGSSSFSPIFSYNIYHCTLTMNIVFMTSHK
jgi:hypothetical protein